MWVKTWGLCLLSLFLLPTCAKPGAPAPLHAVSFCPESNHNFGNVVIGQESEVTLTATNSGNRNAVVYYGLDLVAPFSYKGGTFPGTGGTCGGLLPPSSSCTVVLTFTPTETISFRQVATLSIYTDSISAGTCVLRGNGVGRPGTLDTSFASNGIAFETFMSGGSFANAVRQLQSGKTIVVGDAQSHPIYNIAVVRYEVNGSLDTSFASTGKQMYSFGTFSSAVSAGEEESGKTILTGLVTMSGNNSFLISRILTDGNLDSSFHTDGMHSIYFGTGSDAASDLVLDSSGKIWLGGYYEVDGVWNLVTLRLKSDGGLDTSFNTRGTVATALGTGDDLLTGIALQSDGKLVASGDTVVDSPFRQAFLVRYLSNGRIDTSFSTRGFIVQTFGTGAHAGGKVEIQSDGKIVMGGYGVELSGEYGVYLMRLLSNGNLDTAFRTTGRVYDLFTTDAEEYGGGIKIQTDGKLIWVGSQQWPTLSKFVAVRYKSDGILDTGFGSAGMFITQVLSESNFTVATTLTDDRIVTVGYVSDGGNYSFGIARYWQ